MSWRYSIYNKSGDTFYSLARRYGTTVERIIAANPSVNANNLRVGQVICIPRVTIVPQTPMYPATPSSPMLPATPMYPSTPIRPGACSGFLYTVKAGDTTWNIARTHGTTVEAIAASNPGINVSNLTISQILCIPAQPRSTTCTFPLNISGFVASVAPDAGGIVGIRRDSIGRIEITAAIENVPPLSSHQNAPSNYSLVFSAGGYAFLTMPLHHVTGNSNLWAGNMKTTATTLPAGFFTTGTVGVYPGPVLVANGSQCK